MSVYNQIHEIVFHGQGGYDWSTVYNMPIWLRKYTFNKIKEFYDQKAEANEKAYNKAKGVEKATPKGPNISSYNSKASSK